MSDLNIPPESYKQVPEKFTDEQRALLDTAAHYGWLLPQMNDLATKISGKRPSNIPELNVFILEKLIECKMECDKQMEKLGY